MVKSVKILKEKSVGLKKIVACAVILMAGGFVFAQETGAGSSDESSSNSQKIIYTEKQNSMRIKAADIKLIPEKDGAFGDGGYHLYIRKLPQIESVLLTETTKDPEGKSDSYAYRAGEYNPINGDEVRYLDGKPLISEGAKYSLVDSTTEKTDFFGEAFHIYIPAKLIYGYPWSRNGEIEIGKGTFINIRSFEKKYADYTGDYMDSPFMFNLETRRKPKPPKPKKNPPVKEPEPEKEPEPVEEPVVLTDDYNPVASQKFKEISEDILYSKGPETIIEDINKILDEIDDKNNLDVVFAIDATGSMKNDLAVLKKDLMPSLLDTFKNAPDARFGLLFYRDYGDSFSYKELPVRVFDFTSNLTTFSKNLNSIKIIGKEGGDIPEAVYEAVYASSEFYKWRSGVSKLIILIGDAEPHPTPRGTKKYSKDYVMLVASQKNIKLRTILLPND